jgi:hypothetical protein
VKATAFTAASPTPPGAFTPALNAITGSGSTGIHVTVGSAAVIAGNTISGNGTNPAGAFGRFGVVAFRN